MNDLINQYFGIEDDEIDMEVQIAGGKEKRDELMPLVYVSSSRERANVDSNIKQVLREYHDSNQSIIDSNNRMKPLDVVKVMMGIYSDRECIKRFMNNSRVWARF